MSKRKSFSAAGSAQFLAPKEAPTTRPAGSTTLPTPSLEGQSARMFPARLRLTDYNMSVIFITVSHAIEYFNSSVQVEIEAWPEGLKARYRALTIRMADHGPNLGMPHTRAMGRGLFEIRVKSAEGIGRAFYLRVGRTADRDSARIREENRENPAQRVENRPQTHDGGIASWHLKRNTARFRTTPRRR